MSLKVSAGNWHKDSSIQVHWPRQVTWPAHPWGREGHRPQRDGHTAEGHGKGRGCTVSNSGREERSGNNRPTRHSNLGMRETHARVSRRVVNKMIRLAKRYENMSGWHFPALPP